MDGAQLRDEAVADRVRSAQEFLDPRILTISNSSIYLEVRI